LVFAVEPTVDGPDEDALKAICGIALQTMGSGRTGFDQPRTAETRAFPGGVRSSSARSWAAAARIHFTEVAAIVHQGRVCSSPSKAFLSFELKPFAVSSHIGVIDFKMEPRIAIEFDHPAVGSLQMFRAAT
jgi:hypothetical protein